MFRRNIATDGPLRVLAEGKCFYRGVAVLAFAIILQ